MKEKLLTPDIKVAIVLWRDAFIHKQLDINKEDIPELESQAVMVRSSGIVLSDNEDSLILALSENTMPVMGNPVEIDYECVLCIPKKYILKKKYLK